MSTIRPSPGEADAVREERLAVVEGLTVDQPKTRLRAQKLKAMGLAEVLGMMRARGLHAIVARIRRGFADLAAA